MKKIENLILVCIAVMIAGIQALYAQASDVAVPQNADKQPTDYLWIIAIVIVGVGLIASVVYQVKHRRDKQANLTGDINNPASGI